MPNNPPGGECFPDPTIARSVPNDRLYKVVPWAFFALGLTYFSCLICCVFLRTTCVLASSAFYVLITACWTFGYRDVVSAQLSHRTLLKIQKFTLIFILTTFIQPVVIYKQWPRESEDLTFLQEIVSGSVSSEMKNVHTTQLDAIGSGAALTIVPDFLAQKMKPLENKASFYESIDPVRHEDNENTDQKLHNIPYEELNVVTQWEDDKRYQESVDNSESSVAKDEEIKKFIDQVENQLENAVNSIKFNNDDKFASGDLLPVQDLESDKTEPSMFRTTGHTTVVSLDDKNMLRTTNSENMRQLSPRTLLGKDPSMILFLPPSKRVLQGVVPPGSPRYHS